ncbi:hypothetical protein [Roseomonas elaeocarpi]|uniref:Uncharacterized protein n=1 Tax=Roseomonas elaeocarpi TaxID=907779 RepID=A0ABV6JML1_9PROT
MPRFVRSCLPLPDRMTQRPDDPDPPPARAQPTPAQRAAAERETRLARALRENLRRRKAQGRAREDAAAAGEPAKDEQG